MSQRDLFVIVPDLDTENAVATLLTQRQRSLQIQLDFEPRDEVDLLRYAGRDSGCYRDAVDLLRPRAETHRHAIVIFDRHGSGADDQPREKIEEEIEEGLVKNGWSLESVAVIVIDPELEAWAWSTSPKVAETLGWSNNEKLKTYLISQGLWNPEASKPIDPKQALALACREQHIPLNARIFAHLARTVGLQACQDPAFQKFREHLTKWFGDGLSQSSAR